MNKIFIYPITILLCNVVVQTHTSQDNLFVFFDEPGYRAKKYHIWGPILPVLESNRYKLPASCLMIPWNILLVQNKIPNVISQLKKMNLHFNGGFTIIDFLSKNGHGTEILDFLNEIGINVVFTPAATHQATDVTFGRSYKNISIEPFPYIAYNGTGPAVVKDIYFSFVGSETHLIRKKLFDTKELYLPGTVIIRTPTFMFEPGQQEYKSILARSRYSLCPRGFLPHSIRFYESLQAGAIPVLISDDIRLPANYDWDKCCIRIKENEIAKIPDVLAQISEEKEQQMRMFCYEAFNIFSGENILNQIKHYYNANSV
jgi:hypothetical protein